MTKSLRVALTAFLLVLALPGYIFADCNGNGVADATDISGGTSQDCNENGVPDECDIAGGTSLDLNSNGIPDECICLTADADCSGAVGGGDIGQLTSSGNWLKLCPDAFNPRADVNRDGMVNRLDQDAITAPGTWGSGNGYHCECEVPTCQTPIDCNYNGIPDSWDIDQGTSADCNNNSIPDDCDIAGGTSTDCDGNGIPDDCQLDCDGDGIFDPCEIANALDSDCDSNLVPDSCDLAGGFAFTQWGNSIIGYSSQGNFGSGTEWHAVQALGEPDVKARGYNASAWIPLDMDAGVEYITIGYEIPVLATGVTIVEPSAPGSVTQIDVVDMDDQLHTVWTGTDPTACTGNPNLCPSWYFEVTWTKTTYQVKGIKVTIDTTFRLNELEQIDAVALHGELAAQPDCNDNGILDICDISLGGGSTDANGNGIPDECACRNEDVNCDGYVDSGDLATIRNPGNWLLLCTNLSHPRTDVNRDGMVNDLDYDACREPGVWYTGTGEVCECDIPDCVVTPDCNSNGIPDSWDIHQGTSLDCNTNGIPDECDIAYGTSTDCDTNGVPDDCQWDCNGDGIYDACEIAMGMDTDCDNNGFPDSCDLEGGFAFIQWADSVAGYSSQYDDGSTDSWHAIQALGKPDVQEHGDSPLAWATLNADDGAEYITLSYKYPVWATGATVVESMAPGFVTQIDAIDLDDQLHTVWSGPDTVNCTLPLPQCEIGELEASWTKTTYLVKGLKITIDTTHKTGFSEQIDAVALHGELPAQTDCNNNGVHDDCESDCNENGVPDECDIIAGTSWDFNSNGVPDECDAPAILSVQSMASHTGITEDLGIHVDVYPSSANVEPRIQEVSGLDLPYIKVEFGKPMSSSLNGTDVTPAAGFGEAAATANLDPNDSSIVLITFSDTALNRECFTFDLAGLPAADGSAVGDSHEDTDFCICYFQRDTMENGFIESNDSQFVTERIGQQVDSDNNLRADIDRSGTIDSTDVSLVEAHMEFHIPGRCFDCNDNFIVDSMDIAEGSSFDCNHNGNLDECDIADGTVNDCNDNGIPDICELASGDSADCNENRIPDECDILAGTSLDANANGIPDECPIVYSIAEVSYIGLNQIAGQLKIITDVQFDVAPSYLQEFELKEIKPCPGGGGIITYNDNIDPDPLARSVSCAGKGRCWVLRDTGCGPTCRKRSDPCCKNPCPLGFTCKNISQTIDRCYREYPSGEFVGCWEVTEVIRVCEGNDCNENEINDWTEIKNGWVEDCNENGIPDECPEEDQYNVDCNFNGIKDICDIAYGYSWDRENDDPDDPGYYVPDECQADCNDNDIWDYEEILSLANSSLDLDQDDNGVIDDCEDCDGDHNPDSLQLEAGAPDCDENGVLDNCQPDTDGDGIIDPCDDCNSNGEQDYIDIRYGLAFDCNGNNIPDSCEIKEGLASDGNGNMIPDECEPDPIDADIDSDHDDGVGAPERTTQEDNQETLVDRVVMVNSDNDDGGNYWGNYTNNDIDMYQNGEIPNENDLLPLILEFNPPSGYTGSRDITFTMSISGRSSFRIWRSRERCELDPDNYYKPDPNSSDYDNYLGGSGGTPHSFTLVEMGNADGIGTFNQADVDIVAGIVNGTNTIASYIGYISSESQKR